MREQMEEPAAGVCVNGLDAPEVAALHNFFDLLVVLVIAMLMRHNGLYPGSFDRFANLHGFVHGKCHRFFVGDQLCAGRDAHLD